jgi:hypothetical protein
VISQQAIAIKIKGVNPVVQQAWSGEEKLLIANQFIGMASVLMFTN